MSTQVEELVNKLLELESRVRLLEDVESFRECELREMAEAFSRDASGDGALTMNR